MQAKEFDRWSRVRQHGMLRFVLRSGVLFYGVPMFLVMTFLIPHPRLSTTQSAALWLLAGLGYGLATWKVQEYRFRKVKVPVRS